MADFYQLSVENVFKATGSNRDGLSRAEYKKKLLNTGRTSFRKRLDLKLWLFFGGRSKARWFIFY